MCMKHKVIAILFLSSVMIMCNMGGCTSKTKLAMPEIVLPEEEFIWPRNEAPTITLKTDEPGGIIYYTIEEYTVVVDEEYTKPIPATFGVPGFILEAVTRKKGFPDSDTLTQVFTKYNWMNPPRDELKWSDPHIGDSVIKGTFAETELYKKLKIEVEVNINGIETYTAMVENGQWEINLDKPLTKDDGIYLYGEATNKVVEFLRNGSDIEIWQYYYSFGGERFKNIHATEAE